MGGNVIGQSADLAGYAATNGWMDYFMALTSRGPISIGWDLFFHGGWIIFVIVLLWALYHDVFLDYRQGQFMSKWKYVLLAIDIPRNNEQTPKAVENLFAALAGVYTSSNLVDKYWNGKVTESFSFEVVSIEGHTRFLIRTPIHFRDFIESIVYSQYPEAEINEVSDYVDYDSEELDVQNQPIPFRRLRFPNKVYDLWGTEFVLVKTYPYPIRTYSEFEHQQTQTFLDPMANLLEVLSKLNAGEQVWIQLVIQPQPPGWGEEAKKVVAAIQGKEYKSPNKGGVSGLWTKPIEEAASWTGGLMNEVIGANPFVVPGGESKAEEDQWKMFKISPGERDVLIRVERKLSKQAFKVKFRMIYLGKKQVFAKGRGVTGITGSLQQFNTADANAFKPGAYTKTAGPDYFFVNHRIAQRQMRMMRWYSNRTAWYGETNASSKLTLLNPEELATVWHFPVLTVKATEVGKIESKKAAPPTRLPYEQRAAPVKKVEERRPAYVAPVRPPAPSMAAPAEVSMPPLVATASPPATPVAPSGSSIGSGEMASKKGAPPSNLPLA